MTTHCFFTPILRCLAALTDGRQFGKVPRPKRRERPGMTIRRLAPVLSLTMFAVVLLPGRGFAQKTSGISSCLNCGECAFESDQPDGGEMCIGVEAPRPFLPFGWGECSQGEEVCTCQLGEKLIWCYEQQTQLSPEEQDIRLAEVLAAIRFGRSIEADGLFFYVRRGTDFVVRRKCDAVEVARVAISEIESNSAVGSSG